MSNIQQGNSRSQSNLLKQKKIFFQKREDGKKKKHTFSFSYLGMCSALKGTSLSKLVVCMCVVPVSGQIFLMQLPPGGKITPGEATTWCLEVKSVIARAGSAHWSKQESDVCAIPSAYIISPM